VQEQPAQGDDGIGVVALGISQIGSWIGRCVIARGGDRRSPRLVRRTDKPAGGVLEGRHRKAEPRGEAVFHVADDPVGDLDQVRDALVAAGEHGAPPGDQFAHTRPVVPPVAADRAEMTGQRVSRAAAVQPGGDGDRPVRQFGVRVRRLQARIVPKADVAGQDLGIEIARQPQIAFETGEGIGEHDHPGGRGDLHNALLGRRRLFVAQRRVGTGEINGAGDKAADPLAAADRVVADGNRRSVLDERLDPGVVQRCGKRRPGADE